MTVVVRKMCVSCSKRPAVCKVGPRNLCQVCRDGRLAGIAKIKEERKNALKQ